MRPNGPRDPVVGPDAGPEPPFPLKLDGEVVRGFGRGSKELGIPTANIPISGLTVGGIDDIESGVYYGWAGLSSSKGTTSSTSPSTTTVVADPRVYPMVMSIGWNPYYKNTVRSVEVHIMHNFTDDFYGSHMNLIITGFIRPEYDYVSKDSLIEDIRTDIEVARRSLEREPYAKLKEDKYLLDFDGGKKEVSS